MDIFTAIRGPREILFGDGQRHSLGMIASKLGRRILVITDERMSKDANFLEIVENLLKHDLIVEVRNSTLPDVPVQSAIECAKSTKDFAADVILGIGGGSCIDMAKCVSLLLSHGGEPQDYYGELKVPGPVIPLIAVPTTAGTGSEVTPVAVLSDSERALKVGISSPYLIPAVALCDPELTVTCPKGLTAITGADALTHAIEAFMAISRTPTPELAHERVFVGKSLLTDQYALSAIKHLMLGLEVACIDGSDATARSNVMLGALMAGLAFGTAGTGPAHAIQYPIGALTNTAHGLGVACMLPYVMAYNKPVAQLELEQIGAAMGLTTSSDVDIAELTIETLANLFERIGIPTTLKDLGVSEDQLPSIGTQALGIERLIKNNSREFNSSSMQQLLAASFSGQRNKIH